MGLRVWGLAGVTALLLPATAARACPNCYAASPAGVLSTYYLSTLLLSLLPFVIIAAVAVVGLRLYRGVVRQEDAGGAADAPPAASPAR